jgi:DNA-binding NarL/FixJ family response regulator
MLILLADDQPKVRFGLRVLLERQSGFTIVEEADNAKDLLVKAQATHPDLILLGWELPGLKAEDTLSALRGVCSRSVVVALSGRPEARQAALKAGADAFVSKADPPERLLATIYKCCADSMVQILSDRKRDDGTQRISGTKDRTSSHQGNATQS